MVGSLDTSERGYNLCYLNCLLIFHDHFSVQILHSQNCAEKVTKCKLCKPMLYFLLTAKQGTNIVKFRGGGGEIVSDLRFPHFVAPHPPTRN